jgi:hypothetical protein
MTKRACASPNSNVVGSSESSGPRYSPGADRNFFGAAYPDSHPGRCSSFKQREWYW